MRSTSLLRFATTVQVPPTVSGDVAPANAASAPSAVSVNNITDISFFIINSPLQVSFESGNYASSQIDSL
jgi:hypothetical protein